LVREIDESVESAMLVGHNPGVHLLACELAGSGELLEDLASRCPTASVAELGFDGPWGALGPGDAELLSFAVPRDLRQKH
jgi:phosphohistidine phosphatase